MKHIKWLILLGGIMILRNAKPRGIRNNNPLNLRKTSDKWVGQVEGHDSEFVVFDSPMHGIRAGMKTLLTYRRRYGLNTIAGIIDRWAPESENDTESYILSVAERMGVLPVTPLALDDYPKLIEAMIYHENGQQPYPMINIREGAALAYA